MCFSPCRLVFGTLYPAYYSYKAVKTKNVKEYVSSWALLSMTALRRTHMETNSNLYLCYVKDLRAWGNDLKLPGFWIFIIIDQYPPSWLLLAFRQIRRHSLMSVADVSSNQFCAGTFMSYCVMTSLPSVCKAMLALKTFYQFYMWKG